MCFALILLRMKSEIYVNNLHETVLIVTITICSAIKDVHTNNAAFRDSHHVGTSI